MSERLKRLDSSIETPYMISDPDSICYYLDRTTPGASFNALIRTSCSQHIFIVRDLESTNFQNLKDDIMIQTYSEDDPATLIYNALSDASTIAFDALSQRCTIRMKTTLDNLFGVNVQWVDVSDIVLRPRICKDDDELAHIKRAASYVLCGYAHGFDVLKCEERISETFLAGALMYGTGRAGSEWTAYPVFIASGVSGCRGHNTASTHKRIQKNEIVFSELGASHERYHAAKMHTVFTGPDAPPLWFVRMEWCLRRALAHARAEMRDGAICNKVDRSMRTIVQSAFEGDAVYDDHPPFQMLRRSGYSIGIGNVVDWADGIIRLDPTSTERLQTGMVLHVIPWVQFQGWGGMGFSDVIRVGETHGTSVFERDLPSQYPYHAHVYSRTPPCPHQQVAIDIVTAEMIFAPTPMRCLNYGSLSLNIKDERHRLKARSFKINGVAYAIEEMILDGRLAEGDTVTSMSDGNHGEALALVAKQKGLQCVVYVPSNVPEERITAICALGAQVYVVNGTYDDCIAHMKREAEIHKYTIVSDTAWPGYTTVPTDITSGYTRIFVEALQSMPSSPTHAFIPAGVGSLLAAACCTLPNETRIVCVEPADAACVCENIRARRTVNTLQPCSGTTNSDMQGLNCGIPSTAAYPIIDNRCNDFVVIGDAWAHDAMRWLHEHELSTSATGAASMAGCMAADALRRLDMDESSNVLIVVTEDVTDTQMFTQIVHENAKLKTKIGNVHVSSSHRD